MSDTIYSLYIGDRKRRKAKRLKKKSTQTKQTEQSEKQGSVQTHSVQTQTNVTLLKKSSKSILRRSHYFYLGFISGIFGYYLINKTRR